MVLFVKYGCCPCVSLATPSPNMLSQDGFNEEAVAFVASPHGKAGGWGEKTVEDALGRPCVVLTTWRDIGPATSSPDASVSIANSTGAGWRKGDDGEYIFSWGEEEEDQGNVSSGPQEVVGPSRRSTRSAWLVVGCRWVTDQPRGSRTSSCSARLTKCLCCTSAQHRLVARLSLLILERYNGFFRVATSAKTMMRRPQHGLEWGPRRIDLWCLQASANC